MCVCMCVMYVCVMHVCLGTCVSWHNYRSKTVRHFMGAWFMLINLAFDELKQENDYELKASRATS